MKSVLFNTLDFDLSKDLKVREDIPHKNDRPKTTKDMILNMGESSKDC